MTACTTGAVGATGGAMITTSADELEIQPPVAVTLKLYVPGLRFAIVADVPVPVTAPGLMLHVPVEGSPFSITLPVVEEHVEGWVIVPTIGAVGGTGGGLITTSAEACDIQPGSL